MDREGLLIQNHAGNSISPLIGLVDAQLTKGIAPSEICVVLDVDGTLTQNRDPSGNPPIVQERGMARAVVNYLVNKGVSVVFSSAWPNFKHKNQKQGFIETMQRLMKLNFGIPDLFSSGPGYEGKDVMIPGEGVCDYVKDGHVVSVANAANRSFGDGYARAKYLAPFLFDPDQAKNLKVILFADDDLRNTQNFRNGINVNKEIYPALVHVDMLLLDGNYTVSEQNAELMRFVPQDGILAEATYTPPVDQALPYLPHRGVYGFGGSSGAAAASSSQQDPNARPAPSFYYPPTSRILRAPGEEHLTPAQLEERRRLQKAKWEAERLKDQAPIPSSSDPDANQHVKRLRMTSAPPEDKL